MVGWVRNESEDLSGCHEIDKLPAEKKVYMPCSYMLNLLFHGDGADRVLCAARQPSSPPPFRFTTTPPPSHPQHAEDYILSRCMANSGTEFRQHDGFHHMAYNSLKVSPYDAKQGAATLESRRKHRCPQNGA